MDCKTWSFSYAIPKSRGTNYGAAFDEYTRRKIRWEFDWLSSKNAEAAEKYTANHLNSYEKKCVAAETFDLIPCLAEDKQCDMNCLYFEGRCVK